MFKVVCLLIAFISSLYSCNNGSSIRPTSLVNSAATKKPAPVKKDSTDSKKDDDNKRFEKIAVEQGIQAKKTADHDPFGKEDRHQEPSKTDQRAATDNGKDKTELNKKGEQSPTLCSNKQTKSCPEDLSKNPAQVKKPSLTGSGSFGANQGAVPSGKQEIKIEAEKNGAVPAEEKRVVKEEKVEGKVQSKKVEETKVEVKVPTRKLTPLSEFKKVSVLGGTIWSGFLHDMPFGMDATASPHSEEHMEDNYSNLTSYLTSIRKKAAKIPTFFEILKKDLLELYQNVGKGFPYLKSIDSLNVSTFFHHGALDEQVSAGTSALAGDDLVLFSPSFDDYCAVTPLDMESKYGGQLRSLYSSLGHKSVLVLLPAYKLESLRSIDANQDAFRYGPVLSLQCRHIRDQQVFKALVPMPMDQVLFPKLCPALQDPDALLLERNQTRVAKFLKDLAATLETKDGAQVRFLDSLSEFKPSSNELAIDCLHPSTEGLRKLDSALMELFRKT